MLRRARFLSLFCFVGGGLVPFLKFYFWECVVNKVLRMASLHMVFFKCVNGPFFSIVFFVVVFFWRVCSKEPFFALGGWHVVSLRASSPSDLGCHWSPFYLCDKTSVVAFFPVSFSKTDHNLRAEQLGHPFGLESEFWSSNALVNTPFNKSTVGLLLSREAELI